MGRRGWALVLFIPICLAIALVARASIVSEGESPSAYNPTPPIRAAFFYPWYPQAWTQQGSYPYANYTPALGFYDTGDDEVVYRQLQLAAAAHVDAFIASWWGQGHHTDAALQHLIDQSQRASSPNANLRWAIYYESEGGGNPSVDQIVTDLEYLGGTIFRSTGYLRVDDRPVAFVYAGAADGPDMARRWAEAKSRVSGDLYVVLKVYPGYRSDPNQPDSWHQYAPAQAYDPQLPYSVSVSPGYWKYGSQPLLQRDAERFASDVDRMVASRATWQLITTWNEWGEGTGVEPAEEYGTSFVDVLCGHLGNGAGCSAVELGSGVAAVGSRAPAQPSATRPPSPLLVVPLSPTVVGGSSSPQPTASADARRVAPTFVPVPSPAVAPASRLALAPPTATSAPKPLAPAQSGALAQGSVVIAAVGDISCGAGSTGATCRQSEVANLVERMNPSVILTLGDTQYENGEYRDFVDFFDRAFGRLKSIIRPAVGNHEYRTRKASGYFDYFNGVDEFTGPAGDRDKGYYAIDVGAWRLYAINSNCSQVGGCKAGSPQELWLRADLAAHPTSCSLMWMHHPLWSSDSREFELTELRPLYQDFHEAGGELVLVGHSHFYERFAPQTPDGELDLTRGVREIIVGTGGRNVYGFGPIRPNSEVRDGKTFGALKLVLSPSSYEWAFVPISGQTFTDSGSQACH